MKPTAPATPARPAVIRASHAHGIFGCGRTRFWELAKRPDFPRAIVLGNRARGYIIRELEDWAATSAPRA